MTLPLTDVVSIEPDLQQPLRAAQILVNVMRNRLDDDPTSLGVLEFLDRSLAASRGMLSGLGGAIFDSSRVQSTSATVDVGQILREVFEECRLFAAHKGLKFRVFTPPGLRTHSDPLMLRRIVVSNAIKFTASGGVLIGVRRREGALHLQVWDTGPGIAPCLRSESSTSFIKPIGSMIDPTVRGSVSAELGWPTFARWQRCWITVSVFVRDLGGDRFLPSWLPMCRIRLPELLPEQRA